jgi:DNA repair photolyase
MVIYEPKGKAREYAELALNLYRGCGHGCLYCYAPGATKTDRTTFFTDVKLRYKILEQIDTEATKLRGDKRTVLLCFTCDPYQPIDTRTKMTRQAIRLLNGNDIGACVLTKAGAAARRDLDLLQKHPGNQFAVTLTTDNDNESRQWEPRAGLPSERLKNIKAAHAAGIYTWVSFEPVFNPAAVLRLIHETNHCVDFYKIGKMNHQKIDIDWRLFARKVTETLDDLGCKYLIKKDLAAYLP